MEQLWNSFTSTLTKHMNECIPSKTIKGKSSLPWITQEIKHLIRKRDKLYSSYKRTQDHDKRKSFLTFRQQIKSKIKASYLVYLECLLGLRDEESKCDSKRLFSFLGKSKEDQRDISSLNHDSDLITDNTENPISSITSFSLSSPTDHP